MATIAGMLQRWQKVEITEIATEVLAAHSADVVELDRQQLYQSGLDGNNDTLYPYQSETYAEEKHARNPAPGKYNPDLYDTGSFYNKMYLRLGNGTMEIDSSDAKRDMLVLKYGPAILRLDTVSKNGLRKNILQPGLVQSIAQSTGCGT